jgi:hypothetical protein
MATHQRSIGQQQGQVDALGHEECEPEAYDLLNPTQVINLEP